MIRNLVIATALLASALAACSTAPEPATPESIPPGAAAADAPREVPFKEAGSRYYSDRPGRPPRSGLNSDPNNPNGAPGSTIVNTLMR